MMPEWYQLDSSSTMSEQQESAKKKNFKLRHGIIVQLRDAVMRAIGVVITETGMSKLSVSTNSFKDKEEM